MSRWYIEKGPESDVVISCRVRVARNFEKYPFPYRLSIEQSKEIVNKAKSIFLKTNGNKENFIYVDIHGLDMISKQALAEKRLISPDLLESNIQSGAIISKDEKISIMINEEDHLRVQCLFPGMQLEEARKMCNKIDDVIEENINVAYDKEYGYLTCCPTNVGTGMRASVMLHLPALTITGYIKNVLEACSKLGVAVRGTYGEHTEAAGNMFQVSNQVSLGQTENEIAASINNVVSQIIEQERIVRKQLYEKNPIGFEDRIYRSLGILNSARLMSLEESVKLLSDVRLGVNMGIIDVIRLETINEIMLYIQTANLQKVAGKPLEQGAGDKKRAEIIREKLTNHNEETE